MKTLFKNLLFLFLIVIVSSSCRDECERTITYTIQTPIYESKANIRSSFVHESARNLENPGKIYFKDQYIFINEFQKGIHIIDNSDAKSPQNIGFIKIPGNVDIAIKGQTLYADSYMDLLAINISNPNNTTIVKRIEDVFLHNYYAWENEDNIIVSYEEEIVEETVNCDSGISPQPFDNTITLSSSGNEAFLGLPSGSVGLGGSMARFTISQDFLYAVGDNNMQLFDISTATNPQNTKEISLDWGIETIFPYQDNLFIGSTTGMHIYDNQDPANPTYISTYEHIMSCDPVVVEDNYAYVTLRRDNTCQQGVDALDVIDISNLSNPTLVKSYSMQNPHGLGIDTGTLFVCEGDFGLKVFNADDPNNITQNLIQYFRDMNAYDVIPLGNVLLMIGSDGLYQYDYTDPQDLKLLSVIPVN